MDLRCDDVRGLLAAEGAALTEERAAQVADHLDRCNECDAHLARRIGAVLDAVPVADGPSLPAVKELIRKDYRRSLALRVAGLAAAALAVAGTGWALLHHDPGVAPRLATDRSVEAPIPDPPKLADLKETDRNIVQSEGVLGLYLQFCLTCINDPNEQDKQEYLTRSLLVYREVCGRIRSEFERPGAPSPDVNAVTRNAIQEALNTLRSSKLPSVTLFPSRVNGFQFESPTKWRVDHLLGKTPYRLTLDTAPLYVNLPYLKIALGANDALMAKIEEALWFSAYVKLPRRIEDKDPTVGPQALEALRPLLSPRQEKMYRNILGAP